MSLRAWTMARNRLAGAAMAALALAGCVGVRAELDKTWSGALANHSTPLPPPRKRIDAEQAQKLLKLVLDEVWERQTFDAEDFVHLTRLARQAQLQRALHDSTRLVMELDPHPPTLVPSLIYDFRISPESRLHIVAVPKGDLPYNGGAIGWGLFLGRRPAQYVVAIPGASLCLRVTPWTHPGMRPDWTVPPGIPRSQLGRGILCNGLGPGLNVAPLYNAYFDFGSTPAAWSFLKLEEAYAFAIVLLSALPSLEAAPAAMPRPAHDTKTGGLAP